MTDKKPINNSTPASIVAALSQTLTEHNLTKISYKGNDIEVILEADHFTSTAPTIMTTPTPTTHTTIQPLAPTPAAVIEEKNVKTETINSPMIGVLYVASSPTAQPYIKVGDKITLNQDLFIVECMKTMNLIKSPCSGIVKEIYAQNGKAIEYNQPLALIATE